MLPFQNLILLAEEGGQAPPAFLQFAPLVVVFVLFYLLLIRPQSGQRKKREEMLSELKKNDKVVTIGGIIGTIADVTPDRVTLRIDDNTRIKMKRSGIQGPFEESADS